MLAGLRPLLVPSHLSDVAQKVQFVDGKVLATPGGGAVAEVDEDAIYLSISLRNAGTGIAVLQSWRFYPELRTREPSQPDPDRFTRLTRDLYIAPRDIGFWQGAFRDPSSAEYAEARRAIEAREPLSVDVLYGDYEGGQRVITRFAFWPREDGTWIAGAGRHWNLDRDEPRER